MQLVTASLEPEAPKHPGDAADGQGEGEFACNRSARNTRLVLADGHLMLLDMLKLLLEPEFSVIGSVSNGLELIEEVARQRPDIVIADIGMPGCSGIEAARQIRGIDPAIRLIFLTTHEDPAVVAEAFSLGASAYLLKAGPAAEFLHALRLVQNGGRYLSKAIAAGDINALAELPRNERLARISQRELEVLRLVVAGLPMKSIARRLGITARTVAFHKYKAMDSLGLRDNAALMDFAIRHGLIGTRPARRDGVPPDDPPFDTPC